MPNTLLDCGLYYHSPEAQFNSRAFIADNERRGCETDSILERRYTPNPDRGQGNAGTLVV